MTKEPNDRATAARERLAGLLPRLAVSAALFLMAFTAIFCLHRSFAQALVDALIVEAIFVVGVAAFFGALLLVAMKSRPHDSS